MPDRAARLEQKRALFQQPRTYGQLKDAVGVIQRLGQQDLAPGLVILAQGAGQVIDLHQPHRHPHAIAQAAFEGDINLIRFHDGPGARTLRQPLPIAKVVAVAAEFVVNRRLGGGNDLRGLTLGQTDKS
jgi:hypothetical protein